MGIQSAVRCVKPRWLCDSPLVSLREDVMPKYTAHCQFGIEFTLTVTVQAIEEYDLEDRDPFVAMADDESDSYREMYTNYLCEKAEEIIERNMEQFFSNIIVFNGIGPGGKIIRESAGLEYWDIAVPDWRKLYRDTNGKKLRRQFEIPAEMIGLYSDEFPLNKKQSRESMYKRADSQAQEMAETLTSIAELKQGLPQGWQQTGDIKVEVSSVQVYARKTFGERRLGETDSEKTLVKRPKKAGDFRWI